VILQACCVSNYCCVRLFLLAAALGTSILTVGAPIVTSLLPARLRISIRCGENHRGTDATASPNKAKALRRDIAPISFFTHHSFLFKVKT